MNIYLLNATWNGKLFAEILCNMLPIKGMITLDKDGAKKTPEYLDYTQFCEEYKITCLQLHSYNFSDEKDKELLMNEDIDLIIVASWQRLVPTWLIRKCRIGVIGAHGSHEGITKGRGRSPQNWALITGKKEFSISIFWIEEGTDNGAIIDTREFEYTQTDTILTSYIKICLCKADMILKNIENGRIEAKAGDPQTEQGYYLPQRKKEDGMIDWNRDASDIYNMIRGLTKPYPGAFTQYNNNEFVIWSACPVAANGMDYFYENSKNGTVISILKESALVKCKKGFLLIESCTNFNQLKEGMVFKSADYKDQMRIIIDRHREKYDTPLSRLVLDEIE